MVTYARKKKIAENHEFAEQIYNLYAGKEVEIYLGEKSGSHYYSDYDVENKVYVTGTVVGAAGHLLLLDCKIDTPSASYTVELAINAWSITGVIQKPKENTIHISYLFQEARR